jgi:LysM repeat protein/N-acetylmuramoyl-L-alanine amidase
MSQGRYPLRHPVRKVYPGYLKRDKHGFTKRLLLVAWVSLFSLIVVASAGALSYRVKERDTLYSISNTFKISEEQLRLVNGLESSTIKTGQELIIPHDFYMVAPGEGLYSVARKSGVDMNKLLRINQLSSNSVVQAYTKLRIPVDGAIQKVHIVQANESWAILEDLYGMSEAQLKVYSGLSRDAQLREGMQIFLTEGMIASHLVVEGETLYSLARRYGVSVDQLMQYNALNTDVIRAGQQLKLWDPVVDNISSTPRSEPLTTPLDIAPPLDVPSLIDPSDIKYAYLQPVNMYFQRQPSVAMQPSTHYAEPQRENVTTDYADASTLYQNFKKDVASLPSLSKKLVGYKIMLDPGHGGLDPGALGTAVIGNKSYYLVEDEYVYDIALRLYAILIQHGAEVELTILAPNHTIRDNKNLESFVNQKNEVYNDSNEERRPVGGRWGLQKRVELTQKFLAGRRSKSIFMSLHADSGEVSGLVLTSATPSTASKALANKIIAGAKRGKVVSDDYLVLKGNPAEASVLVEVRTMSSSEARALLDPKARQQDAQQLADAILAYAAEV